MTTSLAVTIVAYALCVTGWLTIRSFTMTARPTVTLAAVGVLECAVILLAVLDVVCLVAADKPRELSLHLAYLVASVAILPMVVVIATAGRKEPANIVVAVGSAAVAVVVVRLQMTGAS